MSKNLIAAIASAVLFAVVMYPGVFPGFFVGNVYSLPFTHSQETFAPKEQSQFSKQYFALIQSRDFETLTKYTDPEIVDAQFQEKFNRLANFFPNEAPKSVKFVGEHTVTKWFTGSGVTNTTLASEYEFQNKWILANINLQKQGNTFIVQSVYVEPLKDSFENLSRFTFFGQDIKHYTVFTLALLLLAFNIYVLVLCVKTPTLKMKWLWIIFILIGFGAVSFGWTTGGIYFNPLTIRLPVVEFVPMPYYPFQRLYEPFIVTMSVPLGAIVFLLKRKYWLPDAPG